MEHGEGMGERPHRWRGEQAGGAGEERMEQRGSLGGQCADIGKAKIGLVKSGWRTLAGFIGSFKKNIRLKLTWVTSGLSSFKKTVARILFGSAKWPTLQFAARGGVVNGATLFGSTVVGEAGREAIVPLEHNTEWLDLVAERVAQQVSRDRPIVVQCVLDGKVIANSTVNYINRQARATGVNPLSATI